MLRRPTLYALLLALLYGALASTYIAVSSHFAADVSQSVTDLERIETEKGLAFVALTTAAAFAAALLALRRIDRDGRELVRREHALVQSQGRELAGVLAGTIAHDANNVLTALVGNLELLQQGMPADGEALRALRQVADRLMSLNRRLLHTARGHGPTQRIDAATAVRDTVASLRSHPHLRPCRVVCEASGTAPIEVPAVLLDQIVANLVLNAGEAAGARGLVKVMVAADGDNVQLEVHDNGKGVPQDRRDGLFERLETTKPDGSGLGLFSVMACAKSLGGSVEVGDSPLGGALFTVRLPQRPPADGTPQRT